MGEPTTGSGSVGVDPVASIVVTNYNYARFVGATIDSALAQQGTDRGPVPGPVEVIVVDDGSTDDSLAVIGRYGDRVQLVSQPNGGQAAAFNAGFARCRGPVVLFLDGDDLLDPDAVAHILDAFDDRPDAVRCQFGLRFVDAGGRPVGGGLPEEGRPLPAGDLVDRVATNPDDVPWQPTSGNAFRASTLAELLPMPTEAYRISADHYLSNLSALHGPVLAIDRPLGSYRVHGGNADHRADFDLGRARDILTRTRATRGLLIDHGRRLGVAMPSGVDRFRSLTQDALRLTSYRSAPRAEHPFPDDDWWTLLRWGWRSAVDRRDLSPLRRALAVGWLTALALVPRPLVGAVAARGLTR